MSETKPYYGPVEALTMEGAAGYSAIVRHGVDWTKPTPAPPHLGRNEI